MSKNVLWISVGQLTAKLQAVKVGGLKKILLRCPSRTRDARLYLNKLEIQFLKLRPR